MSRSRFRNTKPKPSLRIVGVDGGAVPARKDPQHRTLLAAVLIQDSRILVVRLGAIHVDGTDATHILTSMLKTLRFDAVMLAGISFAGFNLVDIAKLARSTRRPVIAVIGERPNNAAVYRALRKHFSDWQERWRIVRNAGPLYTFKTLTGEPSLYFEVRGTSPSFAKTAMAATATISRLPEPIRIAGILARGLSLPSRV